MGIHRCVVAKYLSSNSVVATLSPKCSKTSGGMVICGFWIVNLPAANAVASRKNRLGNGEDFHPLLADCDFEGEAIVDEEKAGGVDGVLLVIDACLVPFSKPKALVEDCANLASRSKTFCCRESKSSLSTECCGGTS